MSDGPLLQPRLMHLSQFVPNGARLCDVGTDHAYLPVWLLCRNIIPSAIASDIHAAPLRHAEATALTHGVSDRLDLRLCAGLSAIAPEETDTVVIAGMGGETIAAILGDAPWTRTEEKLLILQPMTKAEYLRKWLYDRGYYFTGESLVRDKGFLYPVFTVRGGLRKPLTPEEQYGGVLLRHDPLYRDYLDAQLQRLAVRIAGLTRASDAAQNRRAAELTELYEALKARKEQIEWQP